MTCLLCPKFYDQKFRWGTPRKIERGCAARFLKPLPHFRPKSLIFPTLSQTWSKNLIPYFKPEALEPGAWPERVTSGYGTYTVVGVNIKREMVWSPNDEEVTNPLKYIPNSRLESTNHTLFQNNLVEIDTLFQTKTAKENIPFGAAHTYISYIRDYPPSSGGAKNALQIMSLAAYARETN